MTSKIEKVRVIINFLVSNFLQKWAGNLIKLFTSFNIFAFVRAVCCATPNGYMVWWYMLAMILNSWWTLVWIKINSFSPLILISVIGNCEEELPKKPVGRQLVVCRPTVGWLSAVCRPTVGRQTADRFCPKYRLPVGRQLTDSRPTGFLGSSSSQLPSYLYCLSYISCNDSFENLGFTDKQCIVVDILFERQFDIWKMNYYWLISGLEGSSTL